MVWPLGEQCRAFCVEASLVSRCQVRVYVFQVSYSGCLTWRLCVCLSIHVCMRDSIITSIVSQRWLWLYGHVARYLEADPAHRVTQHGGGQGDAHKTHGRGKSMALAGNYLVRKGSLLHGDLRGTTTRSGA